MSFQNDFSVNFDDGYLEEISDVVLSDDNSHKNRTSWVKRGFDVFVAVTLSVLLAPILFLLFVGIKTSDSGPAIFRQKRIGRNGQEFECWKFRTMVTNSQSVLEHILATDPIAAAEWASDQKLKKDPRITAIGNFLRKTSLDELPQLWNILKGEMSVVGPRPIVRSEVSKYGRSYRAYISVSPGVTGLWQVNGRNDTSYAERVKLDVEYVNSLSVWNDFKILLLTIPAVLLARGAY